MAGLLRLVVSLINEEARMLFIGDDWAAAHHDIEIEDHTGRQLAKRHQLTQLAAPLTRPGSAADPPGVSR